MHLSTATQIPLDFHIDISLVVTYLLWLAGRHFDRTLLLRRVRGQLLVQPHIVAVP
jgi:hypothetical protein